MVKYLILTALLLVGCGSEQTVQQTSTKAFNDMCQREELFICGDDIPKDDYNGANIYDLMLYSYDEMDQYTYVSEDVNSYDYMQPGIRGGDCDDFAITFMEDNIINGNLKAAQLVVGWYINGWHMWVQVGNVIFDSDHKYGTNVLDDYEPDFILYEYSI